MSKRATSWTLLCDGPGDGESTYVCETALGTVIAVCYTQKGYNKEGDVIERGVSTRALAFSERLIHGKDGRQLLTEEEAS